GVGPVFGPGQQADVGPIHERWQKPVFWFGIPEGRSFREPELSSSAPGFLLLAAQPLSQGVNEVIVSQLVVPPGWRSRRLTLAETFRLGRCDQAQLAIQDADQVIEVAGTAVITGRLAQLSLRTHLALDVGTGRRQEGSQDRLGRLLVEAVLG